MNNKILITIIYLAVILMGVGVVGLIIENKFLSSIMDVGNGFFVLTGGYFLLKNGKFLYTREFKITNVGIAVVIVGAMFKIMHWPYSKIIIAIGYLLIIMCYLIYIIRLSKYNWLSILKLLFIIFFLSAKYFGLNHWPGGDALSIISIVILGILLFYYFRVNKINMINKM